MTERTDPLQYAIEQDIPELEAGKHMADGDTVTATAFDPSRKDKPKTIVVIDRGVPTLPTAGANTTG